MTIQSRLTRHALILAGRAPAALACVLVLGALASSTPARALTAECSSYTVTSYAAQEYPGWTADGSTTTWGAINRGEQIVAASYNLPFGAQVEVEGLGVGVVRDRGYLGARQIDWLVATRGEALEIGSSVRTVCVYLPGEEVG